MTRRDPSSPSPTRFWKDWQKQRGALIRRRERLVEYLGGRCCRCQEAEVPFEFHHPRGRTWQVRKHSWGARLLRYWKDALSGNLELVCTRCHHQINAGDLPKRAERRELPSVPF